MKSVIFLPTPADLFTMAAIVAAVFAAVTTGRAAGQAAGAWLVSGLSGRMGS